jgi:hypothetical protein
LQRVFSRHQHGARGLRAAVFVGDDHDGSSGRVNNIRVPVREVTEQFRAGALGRRICMYDSKSCLPLASLLGCVSKR